VTLTVCGVVWTRPAAADRIPVPGAGILRFTGPSPMDMECRDIEDCEDAPMDACRSPDGCVALTYAADTVLGCVPSSPTYCCRSDATCPHLAGRGVPRCVVVRDDGGSEVGFGVCVYDDEPYCGVTVVGGGASVSATSVWMCLGPVSCAAPSLTEPYGQAPYAEGDCDCDGLKNGSDSAPCERADAGDGGVADGGTARDAGLADAGPPGVDGSVAIDAGTPDSGPSTTDLGGPAEDAGSSADAAPEEDGGGPGEDLGAGVDVDLGPPPVEMDAGLPPGYGVDFRGGGGCVCGAAGAGESAGATGPVLAAAIALGGGWVARRRRRRR
jgi:hypothetical protein